MHAGEEEKRADIKSIQSCFLRCKIFRNKPESSMKPTQEFEDTAQSESDTQFKLFPAEIQKFCYKCRHYERHYKEPVQNKIPQSP